MSSNFAPRRPTVADMIPNPGIPGAGSGGTITGSTGGVALGSSSTDGATGGTTTDTTTVTVAVPVIFVSITPLQLQ